MNNDGTVPEDKVNFGGEYQYTKLMNKHETVLKHGENKGWLLLARQIEDEKRQQRELRRQQRRQGWTSQRRERSEVMTNAIKTVIEIQSVHAQYTYIHNSQFYMYFPVIRSLYICISS